MPHIRAVCQAVIDHPHADGLAFDGGLGLLQQFRFQDHFETRPGDLSRHPVAEWDTASGGQYNVEVIPELNAVGPKGILRRDPMTLYSPQTDLGEWVPSNHESLSNCSNLWKEAYPLGHPRALCLFYYDSRGAYDAEVGYFGEVTSRTDWPEDPGFRLEAYRYAPNPTLPNARYSYVEVQLLGDSETGQWSLALPAAGVEGQARYPRLGWRLSPEDEWQVLREFRAGPHETGALRQKPFEQVVLWEIIDGHLRVNVDGRPVVYCVPANLRVADGPLVAAGPVRLIVYGHAAMVNLSPIRYPDGRDSECAVKRAQYFAVDRTLFGGDPSLAAVAWQPAGTSANAGASLTTVGDEDRWVPEVLFLSDDPYRRAIAYLHEMDFLPVVAEGESDPYETQGENVVVDAKGELTADWRDAECRLVLELDRDAVGDLPDWKGNNKLTVDAGWDDGATTDVATQFTGYLAGSVHERPASHPHRALFVLNARDGFLRLERKFWQYLGSFAGWTLEAAFTRVLNQCGVPDAKIAFTGDSDLVIPHAPRLAERRFDFPETTPVPRGLDRLVRACGYQWGVGRDGVWFCRPPIEYGGEPDFVLDDETAAAGDVTFALRAETVGAAAGGRGFVNSVFVRLDRGLEQDVSWWRDAGSHQTPEAESFIGDDWWHVFVGYDEQSAATLAERILADRLSRRKMLHFRCSGKPGLFPDHFVQVEATGIGVPSGSLFRIIRKRWQATHQGDFTTEFACRWVSSP
ncbi:MAG: hypothetical protein FJX74_05590 [Armatimonadetes bacterium]|nr:hypothetical protein [Armatimonadota bacterium]